MAEENVVEYTEDQLKLMLVFVQKELDPSKCRELVGYLMQSEYADALLLIRNTIRTKCGIKQLEQYAESNASIKRTRARNWKRMLNAKTSHTGYDGFIYCSAVNGSILQWESNEWLYISKRKMHSPETSLPEKNGYSPKLMGFAYRYYNEIDHICTYSLYMLMCIAGHYRFNHHGATGKENGNPKVFQNDLRTIAIQAVKEDKELDVWWKQFKESQ